MRWQYENVKNPEGDLPPSITIGSMLYNNRRRKIYEAFGKVAPCESDAWEILYRDRDWFVDRDWGPGEFRRRPVSEFFELNRDGLPRFVLIPDRYTDSEMAQWVKGYQKGLEFLSIVDLPDDATLLKLENPQYGAFANGYLTARVHSNDKYLRESKIDASAQSQASILHSFKIGCSA